MQNHPAIIVFSHLRWDFVYQRPQQVLSRLAARHRIFFVEEPVFSKSDGGAWEVREVCPNVRVCRPHTPCDAPGFDDRQMPFLKQMLSELLSREAIDDAVLWFYTPMAVPLMENMKPLAVVYDCMDELSQFLGAPAELLDREQALLNKADLVFTGGPSLYRSKRHRHPHVYCFPSSVDAKHFAAASGGGEEAADQNELPHPRLGYYGVIDERIDLSLIAAAATAHPQWQIVMVGPTAKIDPSSLPRNPNIHYLGQRAYADLPAYLRGWDVCLMPFARNRATEFISPTKTLEYMAAGKMIVSTAIADVAEPYGNIVYLGNTPEEFIAACEAALRASPEDRASRQQRMRGVLQQTSWDTTVRGMEQMIESSIAYKRSRSAREARRRTIVVGAGPTGLSAAYHLGSDALLIEQNSRVGGLCRSIEVNGFTFDYAGHIMFSNDPYVHELYRILLGDNVHWQDREAWIYSKDVYTRYPFQASLYGLPPAVIKECVLGAIEARFGSLKNGHNRNSANGNGTNGTRSTTLKDCCADGILESSAALAEARNGTHGPKDPRNFEEFIYKVWGAGIAKHFAIPYNRKLWAVPLNEVETSWLGGRVPLPDLEQMIEGALSPTPKVLGPNARFGYPLRGGFQALMDAWLPHLKGELRTGSRVIRVSPAQRTVTLNDGSELPYEHLISTMPLPVLMRQIDEAPASLRAEAAKLRHISVRCVHLGIGREQLTEKHWIYYPEDTVFHRIFVQGNASPSCNPAGGFGLTCEITYAPSKPLPCDGDDLMKLCIEDCRRVGLLRRDDPVWAAVQCDLPYAYVVYDHGRAAAVQAIREWLRKRNILLAGRYSEWEYYNSDHAFLAGKRAAAEAGNLHQQIKEYAQDEPAPEEDGEELLGAPAEV